MNTLALLRKTFEDHGILFHEHDGVQEKPNRFVKGGEVFSYEYLLQDIIRCHQKKKIFTLLIKEESVFQKKLPI